MIQKFKEAAEHGTTTVLLQGGVHPSLPFDYYLELVRRTVAEVPQIHPHFYSTSEIIGMSPDFRTFNQRGVIAALAGWPEVAAGWWCRDSLYRVKGKSAVKRGHRRIG